MSTKVKVCFNGCSFTWGEGFAESDRNLCVYDRLLTKQFNWASDNIAQKGSSNYQIFMRSAQCLIQNQHDIVFTQWSGLNRIWLSPGPETFYFNNDQQYPDFRYRDIYIDRAAKKKLNQLLLILNHDYQNILDLVDYCNILANLAKTNSTRIVFINGLVPWTDDLINPLSNDLDKSLSCYSKEILDFDNRPDKEVVDYFSVLQKKVATMERQNWVNLFDSFQSNAVDTAADGYHPGKLSHTWMADKITNYINGII